MDLDPDIAVPSVETSHQAQTPRRTQQSTDINATKTINKNVSSATSRSSTRQSLSRLESSPSRTPLKTSRTRPSTPSSTTLSRSPSVASLRNERSSTPRLDRKRSTPNLTVRSSTPAHQPQFRRASSNLNPSTPLRMKSLERPQMTPASVAKDYFRKELESHTQSDSKVVVFTHDSCYGHRYSRPRSTKATLASIVERPERIHATLLGASTAYVRLGERHSDGKNQPHPDQENRPPPFTIRKTTRSIPLSHPAVTHVHGTKWMESLQVMCDTAESKLAMGQKELARPLNHQRDSRGNTLPPLHSGDLYLAAESLAALQGCLGGVCDAIDLVFQPDTAAKRAFVCIRPPGHHCSAELPSGFCWLNNVHVGISYAAMNHGLTHAAIIDFDLHHGDGSQTITWDHNRDVNNMQNPKNVPAHKKIPIGYYSLHDINSYPCEMGDEDKIRNASTCVHNAHGQSIWNVHLEPWKNLTDFWKLYERRYLVLLERAQSFLQLHSDLLRQAGVEPKAAIFLSSGFDASQWEMEGMQRHQVNVPTDFYAKFTADVVNVSQQFGLGVDGRVISVLEGGYSDRALTSGVFSHLCGLAVGGQQPSTPALSDGLNPVISEDTIVESISYEPAWWSAEQLEQLEAMVEGKMPRPIKSKDMPPSTYSSPTQASAARMTEVAKERRSISAQLEAKLWLENAPPEPVPEVDWVTAAYELSRLLIPEDRQTQSHTHEELNAENSRARRDRQSLISLPVSDIAEDKMQLRDRRAKPVSTAVAPQRVATKPANRRTTIAAASELPDPSAREPSRARRRSSAASSVLSSFQDMKLDDDATRTGPSLRAAPAMPSQTSTTAKKSRAPVKKPVSNGSNSSPRKSKASVTNARLDSNGDSAATGSAVAQSRTQAVNYTNGNTANDGIDDLTNSMKKVSIKLKMPTEEQHNANQKRAEEATKAKPKATRKPPVPKIARPKAPTVNGTAAGISKAGTPKNIVVKSEPGTSTEPVVTAAPAAPRAADPQTPHKFSEPSNEVDVPKSPSKIGTPGSEHDAAQQIINQSAQATLERRDTGTVAYPVLDLRMDSSSPPKYE